MAQEQPDSLKLRSNDTLSDKRVKSSDAKDSVSLEENNNSKQDTVKNKGFFKKLKNRSKHKISASGNSFENKQTEEKSKKKNLFKRRFAKKKDDLQANNDSLKHELDPDSVKSRVKSSVSDQKDGLHTKYDSLKSSLTLDSTKRKKIVSDLTPKVPDVKDKYDSLKNQLKFDSTKRKEMMVKIIPKIPDFRSKADSLKDLVKIDSTKRKKILKALIPKTHASISAGYDYGVIPFAASTNYPLGYYNSQGNLGFSMLGLPLNLTYYYSSLKNIAGLNNYYRVSFDPYAYRESLQQSAFKKIDAEKEKLSRLLNIQQTMQQKLSYYEYQAADMTSTEQLNEKLNYYKDQKEIYSTDKYRDRAQDEINSDTSGIGNKLNNDGVRGKVNDKALLYADSITMITNKLYKYNSTVSEIKKRKQELDELEKKLHAVKNKIEYLQTPHQTSNENNPFQSKVESFTSGVKSLDIGLCYPNYSTFLVSGSTVKGINLEWEKKLYFAFTYGKTINTVLTTNNIIQNQLQTGRNLYNFFDFNNVRDSRKIVAFKFGVGKKESNHIHFGALYGVGMPTYLDSPLNNHPEKNLVLEIDGKIVINKTNVFELIYGSSALSHSMNYAEGETPTKLSFLSYRSNAGLIKYTSEIKRTKSRFIVSGRIVDPFFKSFGVGFMRSDNLRYEIKLEQQLGNRVKLTGFYRRDKDNLLDYLMYTTSLQTMGLNINARINKRLTVRGTYTPVIQNTIAKSDKEGNIHRINTISNVGFTYKPRGSKINSILNVFYNYYQLSGLKENSNYQNYSVSNTVIFNTMFKMDVACNYFSNNAGDTINNNTTMVSGNLSFTSRHISVTLGSKYADNAIIKGQIGGLLRINIPLVKFINLEFQIEKLVLGDFYNSYNLNSVKAFPYYGYGKFILSW
ncbi:MAG: coiled-coil domain-containing protein [Bacteroidia bacterium]